ncbi:aldo/keto reductase [Streptomyces radicis]|uniref:Aldo/keto reductase n=1 Tax=Streptomyces radicis TaxID=1750517 RepID=A0A3A9W4A2_9ACTN|nr:aldo/keto reductase [Streptomyces radicis]RKN07582.1 aldo/keto reductase [Streptomyces radicis]RKN18305.1 aldo/keto reductase [Streptomyces radicis]
MSATPAGLAPGERVPLGRTGLTVSRLGLGLAPIGGMFASVPPEVATATVERAWELGLRLYDTAPVYGYGRSEARAGAALADKPRDAFVLCTKVGRLIEPGGPDTQPLWADPPPGIGPRLDHSYAATHRSVAESLDRLGLDRVDVLHIHDPDLDYPTALGGAYRALDELRRDGAIGAVSLGVNHPAVAARFVREAPAPGPDCVLVAGGCTLLDRSAADDLLPLCADRGIAVMAAGVITPALAAAERAAVRAVCDRHGVPPLAAALQLPLSLPAVTTVLVGARTPEEITESATQLAHPIPEAFWPELTEAVEGGAGR